MKKSIIIAVVGLLTLPMFVHADFETNLKYGMSGNDVSQLQELLGSEGCLNVSPSGYFGLLTLNAVKCFQSKYSISPVSGYFGALSRAQANKLVANVTASSDAAEIAETGTTTPVTPCTNGAKFNTQTGQLCDQSTIQAVNNLTQQVQNLTNVVQNLQTQTPVTTQNTGGVGGPGLAQQPANSATPSTITVSSDSSNHNSYYIINDQNIGLRGLQILSFNISSIDGDSTINAITIGLDITGTTPSGIMLYSNGKAIGGQPIQSGGSLIFNNLNDVISQGKANNFYITVDEPGNEVTGSSISATLSGITYLRSNGSSQAINPNINGGIWTLKQ